MIDLRGNGAAMIIIVRILHMAVTMPAVITEKLASSASAVCLNGTASIAARMGVIIAAIQTDRQG